MPIIKRNCEEPSHKKIGNFYSICRKAFSTARDKCKYWKQVKSQRIDGLSIREKEKFAKEKEKVRVFYSIIIWLEREFGLHTNNKSYFDSFQPPLKAKPCYDDTQTINPPRTIQRKTSNLPTRR